MPFRPPSTLALVASSSSQSPRFKHPPPRLLGVCPRHSRGSPLSTSPLRRPKMLAGVRRLARVASALASRRNYLGVVLRGGEGSKPITLKLSLPWKRSPLPKPFESANPMLRVLPPSASGFKDDYRVTITLAENSVVIGSVQLLPKTLTLEDNFVDSSEKNEEENISEDEEDEEAVADTGEGEAEEEAFMVETSAEEYEEYEFYSESSGDALMDLFYQGESAERAVEIEEEEEPKYLMCDQKCSGIRRPSSSSLLDFCYWPNNSLANVTVLQTDQQGNPIWQSSWCFNVDIDSVNDTQDVQGLLSNKHLEYTGPICGSMLEKFKISFNTYYEVKELLGSGEEGQVYRCASLDNSHICAIKWSSYKQQNIQEPRESLIMKKLLHPNVRRIFFAWKEERGQIKLAKKHSVFIAQELCECTLETHLDENRVEPICDRVKIFAQAVSGIRYLHSQGIVHRDIKPANIFIDDNGNVKIGDFGHSGLISSLSCSRGGKMYGTKLYGSPELLQMQKHGVKSDVFSLGMVYAELFGPRVVAAERREWLLKFRRLILSPQWKKKPFSTWRSSELSKDWTGDVSLMMIMLEPSPEERPSCEDILDLL